MNNWNVQDMIQEFLIDGVENQVKFVLDDYLEMNVLLIFLMNLTNLRFQNHQ